MGIAIFVAELTDKDAFLILSLASRIRPRIVFAAGSVAFAITSAIIVTLGRVLISYVSPSYVSLAGGVIMIAYGLWCFFHLSSENHQASDLERKLSAKNPKGAWAVFLTAVALLVLLDLSGDATEVLTILFVARFRDELLVFIGAVIALVSATALETAIGNRLSSVLSAARLRILSLVVFLVIGSLAILSVLLQL